MAATRGIVQHKHILS